MSNYNFKLTIIEYSYSENKFHLQKKIRLNLF